MSNKMQIQEQVAAEFGYEKMIIREVLNGKSFDCSGDLVDYLFLLSEDENENLRWVYFEKEELEKRRLMEKIRQEEKEKFQLLRYETNFMYLKSKCVMCYTHARNIVSIPCSHLSLCEHCRNKADKCPLCQETISCTIKTFRS